MKFAEILKLALSTIWAHKLRSFLTLLGIIIGVAAFMLILSGLLGFRAYIDKMLPGADSNSFTITRFGMDDYQSEDAYDAAQRRNKYLTFEELEFLRDKKDLIVNLGAKAGGALVEVKRGTKKLVNVSVTASEPIISTINNLEIEEGRYFLDSENESTARVAFIGKDIANELFPTGSAIDQRIHLRGMPYRVIGVQSPKGTVFGMSRDNFIVIPIKTYASQFGSGDVRTSLSIVGTSKSLEQFDDAVEEARTLLRVKRKLSFNEKDNFGIFTPKTFANVRKGAMATMFLIVLTVPSIALFVGAIVIMNTMLVSVTERTKEIGLRKTLGASRSNILKQFLVESAVLSIMGGLVGLLLARVLGLVVSAYLIETIIPWWVAAIAVGVCGFVGILAGIFPAWKAAKLDPIEAIQTE